MYSLTKDVIKKKIADSNIIYRRGDSIFKLGNYYLKEADYGSQSFKYYIDGNYGDYDVSINFIDSECYGLLHILGIQEQVCILTS